MWKWTISLMILNFFDKFGPHHLEKSTFQRICIKINIKINIKITNLVYMHRPLRITWNPWNINYDFWCQDPYTYNTKSLQSDQSKWLKLIYGQLKFNHQLPFEMNRSISIAPFTKNKHIPIIKRKVHKYSIACPTIIFEGISYGRVWARQLYLPKSL